MLRYTEKDILSAKLKDSDIDVENYEDILVNTLHCLSYANGNVDLMEFEMLEHHRHIIECDYCGKLLHKKRDGNYHRMLSSKYVDDDAEYPCTDNCCKQCIGRKNEVIFFEKHGTTKNVNAMITKERLGKVPTSRQQVYLAKLLKADLNTYFKGIGFLDIVIENEKIIVEYDGSGHYAGINYGRYTYEEKLEQDYKRDLKVRSLGYKIIRIESESDYLPYDEVILAKISDIKEYLSKSGKEFFKWVIPKSAKDKRYGKLRKINEADLS